MKQESANLDLLRSLAVLLVVYSHFMLYAGRIDLCWWTGITGVCLFFVHTSLVLMWSLERDPRVGSFYVRRIFRIYPLWLFVLATTLLLRIPVAPYSAPVFAFRQPSLKIMLANMLLLMNFRMGAGNIVGASWTLPIEVDMYVVLPVLFVFAQRYRTVWTLLVVDGLMMLWGYTSLPPRVGSLPMCIPYFLPGIIAYVLYMRPRLRVLPGWSFPIFLFGLTGIAQLRQSYRASWLTCLALGLGLPLFREMSWRPVRLGAHTIAKYSYGIYLTHVWVICLALHSMAGYSFALRAVAFVSCLVVLPVVLYHAIEFPMIRFGSMLVRRFGDPRAPKVTERSMNLEPAP